MRAAVVAFACAVLAMASPAPALADNGQLVAVAGGKLVAVNPDGTGLRTLWSPTGEITGLAVSPDGNKVAFSYAGNISIYDFATREVSAFRSPAGVRDVDPAWSRDGTNIGFRRIADGEHRRVRLTLGGSEATLGTFALPPTQFAYGPTFERWAYTLGDTLYVSNHLLEVETGVTGAPAWSPVRLQPEDAQLAYVHDGGLRVAVSPGVAPTTKLDITDGPVAAPRFAPDGTAIVYHANGQARIVPVAERAASTPVPGLVGVTAVDWQPCAATTVSCYSSVPPTCTTNVAQVSTRADQPVQLPAAPCTDPSSLPLSFVLVKGPDNGTLAGTVYTPNPYFAGQDTVTYKVSNGYSESEVIKVTIFVVPRPAPGAGPPVATPNPSVPAAPFLALSVKPRLDRKRTTTARLTCDQPCAFTVRLEGSVRVKKKARTLKGPALRRSLAPGRVLALKLKLPKKPVGKVRTVWITGTVRGATGVARAVKLPVTVR
ncbi:WD40 repeat protein [Solirubrobacter pauli]|uniref:WD40 repeat protein n=1 Tax=Solirubrobacter pauli TaxID=166793 RepID=A0A660L8E1_9ACTN|nr:Ig-like domain-containing protein [Solirubrobacter pauli]RKQ91327.1 WD40 repeat protein [Solirubrobacter pauli]